MVVLLIGGGSVLMNAMIDKLNKNAHRVYVLTGQKENRFSYSHVFEKYNFPYESASIQAVFESIKPDVTVFTGAFDPNYTWERPNQDAVRYMAGLTNILAAFSMMRRGRFLYCSSQEVYEGAYMEDVKEDEPPTPRGLRAMALAQGEEACANYRRTQGAETVTLRFDHMYWVPKKGETENNPCFRMCLEALQTGRISANGRRSCSMVYLSDAVEQVYRLVSGEAPRSACYHITSGETIGEMELAGLVQQEMGSGIEIVDNTVGTGGRMALDGGRFDEEFGRTIFNHYEAGVKRVAAFMKRHSASFLTDEDAGGGLAVKAWNGVRRILKALFPFLENLVCFALAFQLNRLSAGSEFVAKLDFYLLYVLLFALVYGQRQAVVSGFLSVLGYIFAELSLRGGFEVLVDYNTYVWMAQLFIVGLVVGYLKDQLQFIKGENHAQVQYLHGQLRDIEEINDSNVRMKHNFESQVVNHKDSLGKIYDISSTLEQYGPEEVLFYAAQVLSKVMDCADVAVYTVANGDYARLFSATSPDARKLGSSIKYTAMEGLYGELKERRVYINREMDGNLPMMASAVYSENSMQLILMLWGIPWERMTLGEANRLTIVGALIQNAVVRANRYLEALRNRRYVEGTNVLDESAFTPLVKAFQGAREKGLTEYALLEILTGGENYERVGAALGSAIRQTDYLGLLNGGRLYVLLSNTGGENAGIVAERFQNAGYGCRVEESVL